MKKFTKLEFYLIGYGFSLKQVEKAMKVLKKENKK